jgi:hypothetical protein
MAAIQFELGPPTEVGLDNASTLSGVSSRTAAVGAIHQERKVADSTNQNQGCTTRRPPTTTITIDVERPVMLNNAI